MRVVAPCGCPCIRVPSSHSTPQTPPEPGGHNPCRRGPGRNHMYAGHADDRRSKMMTRLREHLRTMIKGPLHRPTSRQARYTTSQVVGRLLVHSPRTVGAITQQTLGFPTQKGSYLGPRGSEVDELEMRMVAWIVAWRYELSTAA